MGKTTFTLKRKTSYPITTKLFGAPVSGVARIVGTSSNLGAMAGKASLGGGRAVAGFGQSVGTHNISGTNWASHYKGMDWNNAIKDFNKTYKVPRATTPASTTSTALVPYKPTTPATTSTSTALTVRNSTPQLPASRSTSTALAPYSGGSSLPATTPRTGGSTSTALTTTASPMSGTAVSGTGKSKSGITIVSDLSTAKEVPFVKDTGPITNTSSTSTSTVTKKSYQSPTTNELVPKGSNTNASTNSTNASTNANTGSNTNTTTTGSDSGTKKKGWSKGKKWAVGIGGTAIVGTGYAAKKVDDAANGIG